MGLRIAAQNFRSFDSHPEMVALLGGSLRDMLAAATTDRTVVLTSDDAPVSSTLATVAPKAA